jgi:hypothetical protein
VRKYQLAALAFAAGSLVVAFGAGSAFGVDRRREKRSISGAD